MKTSIRTMLLGAALVMTACPSESKPDAAAAAAPQVNPTMPPAPPPAIPLTPEEKKKALYVFGALIAQRTPVGQAGLSQEEFNEVLRGLKDAAAGKELEVKMEEVGPKVDQLLKERQQAKLAVEKKAGEEFAAKMAKEKGAKKTATGLVFIEETAGKGEAPKPTDTVSVNYKGTLIDGKEFDSSYKRGTPAEFPLNGVIKCWTEGVAMMKPGDKAKLVCPSDIAYGDRGAPPNIPGGSTLVFEVELLSVKAPAAMPPQAPNLGVPPPQPTK